MKVEAPPCLAYIAGYAGIEKSTIERYVKHFTVRMFGISPGTVVHFINFQQQPKNVKDTNDFDLVERFKFAQIHQNLHSHARQQNEVVSWNTRYMNDLCHRQNNENRDWKYAAERLFKAEI
jgi:hypothetical protein